MPGFSTELSPLGRIVVAPEVPAGHRLFYTTIDYGGAIDPALERVVGMPVEHCHQVHGVTVTRGGGGECDALWSSEPSALAIKTADCLPISLIGGDVIANAHCGWRGAVQGIGDATLDVLVKRLGGAIVEPPARPGPSLPLGVTTIAAWLGPSIRVCCFEVGEEVAAQFPAEFVARGKAKPHVDIAAFAAARLRARGVARVYDSQLCTRCPGSIFHSFRRDGRGGGRNLAILIKH